MYLHIQEMRETAHNVVGNTLRMRPGTTSLEGMEVVDSFLGGDSDMLIFFCFQSTRPHEKYKDMVCIVTVVRTYDKVNIKKCTILRFVFLLYIVLFYFRKKQ